MRDRATSGKASAAWLCGRLSFRATGRFEVKAMPVIRYPNFSDRTADLDARDFTLLVGNEKGRSLEAQVRAVQVESGQILFAVRGRIDGRQSAAWNC